MIITKKKILLYDHSKKNSFNYKIKKKLEIGLVLTPILVYKIKNKQINLLNSFVVLYKEVFCLSFIDTTKKKQYIKILLKKTERKKLYNYVNKKGFTIKANSLYILYYKIKMEIIIGEGLKKINKKEKIKKRIILKETKRKLKYK